MGWHALAHVCVSRELSFIKKEGDQFVFVGSGTLSSSVSSLDCGVGVGDDVTDVKDYYTSFTGFLLIICLQTTHRRVLLYSCAGLRLSIRRFASSRPRLALYCSVALTVDTPSRFSSRKNHSHSPHIFRCGAIPP